MACRRAFTRPASSNRFRRSRGIRPCPWSNGCQQEDSGAARAVAIIARRGPGPVALRPRIIQHKYARQCRPPFPKILSCTISLRWRSTGLFPTASRRLRRSATPSRKLIFNVDKSLKVARLTISLIDVFGSPMSR